MAAMRSALVMLGRRCSGSSGSSTVVSMVGGRGLEVHDVFRTSAPLLRPSTRNLELQGLRRFSASGMECADQKKALLIKHKAENAIRLWWPRSSDHLKNYQSTNASDPYVKNCRYIHVFGTIIGLASLCYMVMIYRSIHHRIDNRSSTMISPLHSHVMPKRKNVYCALPFHHPWRLLCRSS